VCREDGEKRELCHFQCQRGFVVNPVADFETHFDCWDGGKDFARLSALMKRQEPCLGEST
jgi:hypothetical protein